MRMFIHGLALLVLSACRLTQNADEDPASARPKAGTYRGDHGEMTAIHGLESELILSDDGAFRYFLIDSNTALYTSKGRWSSSDGEMVWTGHSRSYLYHGSFRQWDTLDRPDTTFLRNVSDSGFERLEITYDTLFTSVLRWVNYRRINPAGPLQDGFYEFTETYADEVDPTVQRTGITRLEITRNGPYKQAIYRDGVLLRSDEDSRWFQSGTHLITTGNRHCEFEPGYSSCHPAPADYEYVARLSGVGDTAFSLWMAPSFSFQESPHWAVFVKAPSIGENALVGL